MANEKRLISLALLGWIPDPTDEELGAKMDGDGNG